MNARNMTGGQPAALYQKVKQHILDLIESGAVRPGERLPSEQEFVRDRWGSRMTINRALRELAAEGYVTRIQGVGTFASEAKVQSEIVQIRNIADEIRERGHTHKSALLELREVAATATVANALGVAPCAPVFHSLIVHYENDVPIQVEDRYVNPRIAPDYLSVDFLQQTPNEFLVKVAPIGQVRHVIDAVMPSKRICKLLHISERQPCLRLFRLTWSNGIPGTCAWLTYPGHLYRMVAQFALGREASLRDVTVRPVSSHRTVA